MHERIQGLDDKKARMILSAFTNSRLRSAGYETQPTPELRGALEKAFCIQGLRGSPQPNEGDLARQALLVLAEDPHHHAAIMDMIDGPAPVRFALVEKVAVVTAALLVLQTHVKFERHKDGKMSLMIEKKPTSDRLLKPFVEKLIAYLWHERLVEQSRRHQICRVSGKFSQGGFRKDAFSDKIPSPAI